MEKFKPMPILRRNSISVFCREPFALWVKQKFKVDIPVAIFQSRPTIFLLPFEYDAEAAVKSLSELKPKIAAQMFFNWFETTDLPEEINTPESFDKWFDLSFDSMVLDASEAPLRYLSDRKPPETREKRRSGSV